MDIRSDRANDEVIIEDKGPGSGPPLSTQVSATHLRIKSEVRMLALRIGLAHARFNALIEEVTIEDGAIPSRTIPAPTSLGANWLIVTTESNDVLGLTGTSGLPFNTLAVIPPGEMDESQGIDAVDGKDKYFYDRPDSGAINQLMLFGSSVPISGGGHLKIRVKLASKPLLAEGLTNI